ncbi:MAG: hypothetical protein ABIJ09_01455 [Pseudomonadota bacterium]
MSKRLSCGILVLSCALLACPVEPTGLDASVARDASVGIDRATGHDATTTDSGRDAAMQDLARSDATTSSCGISFEPNPATFDATRLSLRVDQLINLVNNSDTDVSVTSVSIVNNSTANEFAIAADSPFTAGIIPSGSIGNSRGVKVSYTPRDALADTSDLQVVTTCPGHPIFTVELNGQFVASPTIVVTDYADVDTPMVSSVDFGDVRQSSYSEVQLFIKNITAGSALTVQGAALNPTTGTPFTSSTDRSLPYTLSQWDSFCAGTHECDTGRQEVCVGNACQSSAGFYLDQVVVTVRFTPTTVGEQWVNLRIHSDDAVTAVHTIAIRGNGVPTTDCPARFHAPGAWNPSTLVCVYTCESGWVDLNGDLNALNNSNGCETQCTAGSSDDVPDLNGLDSNCDGMDGDPTKGFFVSLTAPAGGTGSQSLPFNSLQAGLTAASTDLVKKNLYLADETYTSTSTVVIPPGIKVYGGYVVQGQPDGQKWRTRTGITSISGPSTAVSVTGASAQTVLQKIVVRATNGTGASVHSIALKAVNSPGLELEAVTLQAGNGVPGAAGSNGNAGAGGNPGTAGKAGCQWNGPFVNCKDGGRGGAAAACAATSPGAHGGQGGYLNATVNQTIVRGTWYDGVTVASGQYLDSATAHFFRDDDGDFAVDDITGYVIEITNSNNFTNQGRFTITELVSDQRVKLGNASGLVSETNLTFKLITQYGALDGDDNTVGAQGGSGGDRAGSALYASCYGQAGFAGVDGQHGNPGAGGAVRATRIVGTDLLTGDAFDGEDGVGDAAGGTAGGGGGGGDCGYGNASCVAAPNCGFNSWGGGGGAGGSAGCPGQKGAAGTGGGSSIGILAINSPLDVIGCTITTGNAGDGGAGGNGGAGGTGGSSGAPGAGAGAGLSLVPTSGAGGQGGQGGRGGFGGGGGGGAGGDTIGIAYSGGAPVQSGVNTITTGTAGNGGSGGTGATTGFCNRANSSECGDGQDGSDGRDQSVQQL